jgi:hypothetical protein
MGWVVYGAIMFSGVVSLAMQSAVYYRPLPDYTSTGGEVGMTKMREIAADKLPLTLKVAQFMVISFISTLCKFYLLGIRNSVEIVEDDNYKAMLTYWRRRPRNTGLITVANHASSFDDPGLIAAITPLDIILQPRQQDTILRTTHSSHLVSLPKRIPSITKLKFIQKKNCASGIVTRTSHMRINLYTWSYMAA